MFSSEENINTLIRRLPIAWGAILFVLLIIAARLYYLQIVQGDHYNALATTVFIREVEITAKRGQILDRHGEILAATRPYYEILMIPQYVVNKEKTIESLLSFLPLDKKDLEERLAKARYEAKFKPVVIADDVPYDWIAKLKSRQLPDYSDSNLDLSGVEVRQKPLREYLYPELFSHALGYLKEIDKDGLKQKEETHKGLYTRGDLIGASGVEYVYDDILKGFDGQDSFVVDARGRAVPATDDLEVLRQYGTHTPIAGLTLQTTLDLKLQKIAAEALGNYMGAVVALDPNTGEVLVLYSSPGFDPNRITKSVDKKYWQSLHDPEKRALYNRAARAAYPPASTYKLVTLAAALQEKKVHPINTKINCSGGYRFGNRVFKCWNKGGHGSVNAIQAIGQSCDVYFYKVGLMLGVDKLKEYASKFGFGQKTGVDLSSEGEGLIPSTEWKLRARKEKWYESETLSVSIGQSYNLTTPLQNAVAVSTVANGGKRVTPHLIKTWVGDDAHEHAINFKTTDSGLSKETLDWVKKGMIEVVHGWGTAKRLQLSPNKIAGKTGTAQTVSHGSGVRGKKALPHALFVSFAPYDNPKIAVAVMVEHGIGGSATAAPIAMQIIDAYLGTKDSGDQKP